MGDVTLIRGTRYEVHTCITCGVVYALSEAVSNEQRLRGGYHYCPNGHSQGWDKNGSELERMRRERDRAVQNAARLADETREAEAKAEAARKALLRHKKRAAAGTCPCCKRTFSDMARHMNTKHPDFVDRSNVVALKEKSA